MTDIMRPIHTATIRGHRLRFYRTPRNDGRPDLPWHSADDLQACFGLNRQERRAFLQIWRRDHTKRTGFLLQTVATEDGLVTIAPHYAGQGTCSALSKCLGIDIEDPYGLAATDAMKQICGHLHGEDLLQCAISLSLPAPTSWLIRTAGS
jgi:hypothetical protein